MAASNPAGPRPPDALAPLPEPPWYKAKPHPREPITRDIIVEAAIGVLDKVGMDGLSMRRVAEQLGTGAASLYWHVRNKEELFQLIFERVSAEVSLPAPDPSRWKEQLKELGLQMKQALSKHRDVARLSLGRVPVGPQMALFAEWLFSLLQPVGIPDRAISYLGDIASLYVGAYCFEESLGISSPTGEEMGPAQIVQLMRDYWNSLPPERFPRTLAALDLLFEYNPEERFEFGLDLLIDGLERYAVKSRQGERASREQAKQSKRQASKQATR